jgi:hypothetical protein
MISYLQNILAMKCVANSQVKCLFASDVFTVLRSALSLRAAMLRRTTKEAA